MFGVFFFSAELHSVSVLTEQDFCINLLHQSPPNKTQTNIKTKQNLHTINKITTDVLVKYASIRFSSKNRVNYSQIA